ncbi:hypothetical protein [Hyphomicrobium zavarzinii]|uniref:hypothetical protein n=1 Tax=Hyphomicrobium zavarzinii TaxID=48292 RepID=UPI0012EB5943|nr:hypothetical protein [Hyphomicrobium zavarzinii]
MTGLYSAHCILSRVARTDGGRLTKLGAIPASTSIATIVGYQKVIVSPTSGPTGAEKLR